MFIVSEIFRQQITETNLEVSYISLRTIYTIIRICIQGRLISFHLNGHTSGFHTQSQKLESLCAA